MENFVEKLERALYEKVIARDEHVLKKIDMSDVRKIVMNLAAENPEIKYCALDIRPGKKNRYKISLAMLNDAKKLIYVDGKRCVGKVVEAEVLADNVVEYMKGEYCRVMELNEVMGFIY